MLLVLAPSTGPLTPGAFGNHEVFFAIMLQNPATIFAAICLRRFGLEEGPIDSMLKTLQFMAHEIHTALG